MKGFEDLIFALFAIIFWLPVAKSQTDFGFSRQNKDTSKIYINDIHYFILRFSFGQKRDKTHIVALQWLIKFSKYADMLVVGNWIITNFQKT